MHTGIVLHIAPL